MKRAYHIENRVRLLTSQCWRLFLFFSCYLVNMQQVFSQLPMHINVNENGWWGIICRLVENLGAVCVIGLQYEEWKLFSKAPRRSNVSWEMNQCFSVRIVPTPQKKTGSLWLLTLSLFRRRMTGERKVEGRTKFPSFK